jgi:hypothetical protein
VPRWLIRRAFSLHVVLHYLCWKPETLHVEVNADLRSAHRRIAPWIALKTLGRSERLMVVFTTLLASHRAPWLSNRIVAGSFVQLLSLSLGAILLCLLHPAATSAQINYGSFSGTTVDYLNVTEQTTTADSLPLFAAPALSANSLDFNPVGFDATASDPAGPAADTTGARLTFTIQAHAGQIVPIIVFSEAGDTTLAGAGTDNTSTEVTANGTITINAVDGAPITPVVRPISLAFSPSGGDYGLATDGGGLPIFHTSWSGSLSLNLAQILTTASVPFTLGATNVSIDLVNTLAATSEAGTQALIGKKDFSVAVVPEPTSLALVAVAWISLFGVRSLSCRRIQLRNFSASIKRQERTV